MKIPKELKDLISQITGKRARAVIDHILEYGSVTTEEIEKMGYAHPPRAVRDVRENGVPIQTIRVRGKSGKIIAAYKFDDFDKIKNHKLGGRKVFSKQFKELLIKKDGFRCAICNEEYHERYLQIDHRVPYEVSGDDHEKLVNDYFMLICATCNRKKSWSCENCENWKGDKNKKICKNCFWSSPEEYKHIALEEMRRTDLVFKGEEIPVYEKLSTISKKNKSSLSKVIKDIIKKEVQ